MWIVEPISQGKLLIAICFAAFINSRGGTDTHLSTPPDGCTDTAGPAPVCADRGRSNLSSWPQNTPPIFALLCASNAAAAVFIGISDRQVKLQSLSSNPLITSSAKIDHEKMLIIKLRIYKCWSPIFQSCESLHFYRAIR